jgi:hypothetical protein
MHQESNLFEDATKMIEWLTKNNIKILPRQLDGSIGVDGNRIYNQYQVQWFDTLYKTKSFGQPTNLLQDKQESNLTDIGRACCGGRSNAPIKIINNGIFMLTTNFLIGIAVLIIFSYMLNKSTEKYMLTKIVK